MLGRLTNGRIIVHALTNAVAVSVLAVLGRHRYAVRDAAARGGDYKLSATFLYGCESCAV